MSLVNRLRASAEARSKDQRFPIPEHMSIFTQAADELEILQARVELLREAHTLANDALRSAWSVADRDGRETNWAGHRSQLRASLEASHAAMAALDSAPQA